jgi:hypothetical protein
VSVAPPTERELDAYREEADRFNADLLEEYYLHLSGQKETLELERIYDEYRDLTELEAVRRVGAAANGGRRTRELYRFACEGFLGNLTRRQEQEIAELEASLVAHVDGEEVSYRMLKPTIANEDDRATRERLERARNELQEEHLTATYLDATLIQKAEVRKLGVDTYLELYRDRFGMELDRLAEQCRALLDSTERLYEDAADRFFRARVGVGLGEVQRWDVARAFRAPQWDTGFPKERMLPALEGTLRDLGIDLASQANVELDVEQRPKKDPRAFCAPIEVPGRVVLVIQPIGGADDWAALFHEAGHTEHFAHTDPGLAIEEKRFGDNAVTEGWAALLEHLTDDAAWLTRMLSFPKPREFAAEGATRQLYIVRRYCAKLLYELEFHAAQDPRLLQPRYTELLGDALKVEPSPTDYLSDLDAGFYVSSYLRSWAFEAQLRDFLRSEFGTEWFAKRDAGSLLRELWSLGQKPTAEELLQDVTGAELHMDAVGDRVRAQISA